ncbi:3'-5' exonuclease [Pontibacter rugosus]|uniref:Exonuclease domain-containing protein n=1 Tax=Pontibacter rugosus TaxID=1745966 RepID=A0ABW3SKK3_9BACT
MWDYIIFIDTETTGIPRDWKAPYSDVHSWPYSVQVAWLLYTKEGKELKSEDHYIYEPEIEISEDSYRIHGITKEFLQENGKDRKTVLSLLAHDLEKYKPLVVGHFMQLDYHILGVGFHRANLPNPLPQLTTFCTMDVTAGFLLPPRKNFLRLGELYQHLFQQPLELQHNAYWDARATAACFFRLQELGDISEESILKTESPKLEKAFISTRILVSLFVLVILVCLLIFWL